MTYINPNKWMAHLDRVAARQAGKTPAPVTVEWDLSNRCYLGCRDCHFAHTHVRGPWASQPRTLPMAFDPTGDLADAALVSSALGDMARLGVRGVIWSGGGEPTTHPAWPLVLQRGADVGLRQGMYTAGGLLDPVSAGVLATNVDWVVVSLDAPDSATYAAEKSTTPQKFFDACRGASLLSETGRTAVGVSFLLHGENWMRAKEMHDLARGLGATYTTFRPAIRTSPANPSVCADDRAWVDEAWPLLAVLADEPDVECDPGRFVAYAEWAGHGYDTCYGVGLTTVITPDGRVWACPQRRGIGAPVGDLRGEPFEQLWSRWSGRVTVDKDCRVMCRLHLMNQELVGVFAERAHEEFL